MLKRILLGIGGLLLVSILLASIVLSQYNNFQSTGTVKFEALDKPVRVVRDSQGIPYVYAESFADVLRGQGFVTAQDRLLQIQVSRYLVNGRLAELFGESVLETDIRTRVLGIPRHGRTHTGLLNGESREYLQFYLDGLNAYIETRQDEHQLGLELLGLAPEPWTIEESMALRYFLSWSSTPNVKAELVALALTDELGPARAVEISQLTVNPDGEIAVSAGESSPRSLPKRNPGRYRKWLSGVAKPFEVGSNQWVVSPKLSTTGAAIFANNPHIDSRTLPGIWHPVGLITPEFRAIGVSGPGAVGLAVARTSHIAFGVTNSNGDGLDLFIERPDPDNPDNYLDNGKSIPYRVTEEVIKVLNRETGGYDEHRLRIRFTSRGPIISDHGMTMDDGRVISLRWAAPEAMDPDAGLLGPLLAKNVREAGLKIGKVNAPYNYVVADKQGDIAHYTAGIVPIRRLGNGGTPLPVDVGEAWNGMIPAAEMPGMVNPPRGWVGNANNRTLPGDYRYAYSTYFAHSWRYRRMLQLLDTGAKTTPQQHWDFMFDVGNTLAERLTPLMIKALEADEATRDMAALLVGWDYVDEPDRVAPTVFQSIWRNFARRVYQDELGEDLAMQMLTLNYYWEDRLETMIRSGESNWFDDIETPDIEEGLDDLFRLAAIDAREELTGLLGADSAEWQWGKLHTITFFSPVIPGDFAADVLGAGTLPKEGSGETLNRAKYRFDEPYRTTFIDSLRFLADMSDDEKVMAVLSGGASGRQFDPHLDDQLPAWLSGEPNYWWLSDAAIEADAQSEMLLVPD